VTARINADPEVARFLKEQRELERQLRGLKEELDMAEQAGKIEKESREWAAKRAEEGQGGHLEIDGELVVLIGKWREASRAAAEELFGRVRDRVNR
jgi:Swi5-dependent recombination DNA repair protein 1